MFIINEGKVKIHVSSTFALVDADHDSFGKYSENKKVKLIPKA